MEVLYPKKNQKIVTQVEIADTFFKRFKGLMGREEIPEGFGLLIKPCNSVHTCFMKLPIDVLFINKDFQMIEIIKNMQPFRFSPILRDSAMVLELPAGTAVRLGLMVGDKVKLQSQVI